MSWCAGAKFRIMETQMTCAANSAEMRRLNMNAQVMKSQVSSFGDLSCPKTRDLSTVCYSSCLQAFLIEAKLENPYDLVAEIISECIRFLRTCL